MLSGSALCPITIDRMPNGTTAANSHGYGAMARIAPPTVGANAAALAAVTVFRPRPRPRCDSGQIERMSPERALIATVAPRPWKPRPNLRNGSRVGSAYRGDRVVQTVGMSGGDRA